MEQHMATATQLSVSDAAAHVGVTRQTIFKQIKSGKLSATKNRRGHLQVNIVELMRVYGDLQSPEQVAQSRFHKRQHVESATTTTTQLQLELERAKLQIERRDFELEQLRSRLDEMRERERTVTEERLRLFGIIERQSLLLSAPQQDRFPTTKTTTKAAPKVPTKATAAKKAVVSKAIPKKHP